MKKSQLLNKRGGVANPGNPPYSPYKTQSELIKDIEGLLGRHLPEDPSLAYEIDSTCADLENPLTRSLHLERAMQYADKLTESLEAHLQYVRNLGPAAFPK